MGVEQELGRVGLPSLLLLVMWRFLRARGAIMIKDGTLLSSWKTSCFLFVVLSII